MPQSHCDLSWKSTHHPMMSYGEKGYQCIIILEQLFQSTQHFFPILHITGLRTAKLLVTCRSSLPTDRLPIYGSSKSPNVGRRIQSNNALQLTAYSVRSAPASGSS